MPAFLLEFSENMCYFQRNYYEGHLVYVHALGEKLVTKWEVNELWLTVARFINLQSPTKKIYVIFDYE